MFVTYKNTHHPVAPLSLIFKHSCRCQTYIQSNESNEKKNKMKNKRETGSEERFKEIGADQGPFDSIGTHLESSQTDRHTGKQTDTRTFIR